MKNKKKNNKLSRMINLKMIHNKKMKSNYKKI